MLMIPPCTFLRFSIDDQHFRKSAGKPQNAQIQISKISDRGKANLVLLLHMFGEAPLIQLYWLNRVESKAFCLINSTPLTDCLQPLCHRRNVASLALFYSYFHANSSYGLANCMPPLLPRPRCKRLPLTPFLSISLMQELISQSFISFSGKLWNSLSASVFPSTYDLNSFKREVSRHLTQSFGLWTRTFTGTSTSVGFFVLFFVALGCLPST